MNVVMIREVAAKVKKDVGSIDVLVNNGIFVFCVLACVWIMK